MTPESALPSLVTTTPDTLPNPEPLEYGFPNARKTTGTIRKTSLVTRFPEPILRLRNGGYYRPMLAEPLLRVEKLSVRYAATPGTVPVLRDVAFDLHRGEVVALAGESGGGKTTLALAITRMLPAGAAVEGSVRFEGQEVMAMAGSELRRLRASGIATIFQEPALALHPLKRIEEQVGEAAGVANPGWDGKKRRAEARAALAGAALNDERIWRAYPHEISGGQRQRALIAQALVRHPALILADEPAAALDAATRGEILKLFAGLTRRLGIGVLLIAHDLSGAQGIVDREFSMVEGRVAETVRAGQPVLARREAAAKGGEVEMEALNIHKRYAERRWFGRGRGVDALCGVSLRLRRGTTLAVAGASGSGKSTLARCLARLIEMDAGEVRLAEYGETPRRGREIQLIPQDPGASLNPRFSAEEIVAEPLAVQGESRRAAAREWMERVGLDPRRGVWPPGRFSGGQRARLALARALVLQPRVLILDESLSSLDSATQARMVEILLDLQKACRLSYVLIAHDFRLVRAMADDVIVMEAGKVVERGTAREVMERPLHERTKALLAADAEIG